MSRYIHVYRFVARNQGGIPFSGVCPFIYLKPPYAIGPVPSLSGHAFAYRWRSLPRVRRHRASKPQGSSERVLPWRVTMDQLIWSLFSTSPILGMKWTVESTGENTDGTAPRKYSTRIILRYGAWCGTTASLLQHYSVCVCVFFPFILDIKFVGRTSRGHTGGRSHRIFHPPSFCGACFIFSREKDSAIPFPCRP